MSKITLKFNVQLEDTWKLYSTDRDPNIGSSFEFVFVPNESYELIRDIEVRGVKQKLDLV